MWKAVQCVDEDWFVFCPVSWDPLFYLDPGIYSIDESHKMDAMPRA